MTGLLLAVIPAVVAAMAAIAAATISYVNGLKVNRLTALSELDKAVHDERLKRYPKFVQATASFALYFSKIDIITQEVCEKMGKELSEWYFNEGGLLLSIKSRDAYFVLQRALTKASAVVGKPLNMPSSFARDRTDISSAQIKSYQKSLGLPEYPTIDDIEKWKFGEIREGKEEDTAERLKDFVILQILSSRLRTALSDDLRSRIAPGA